METRQLRYFVAVAQARHFGRAAERLGMAQSPLSQAIRQLETQLGATLFYRTTRRVELTVAGEALLRDALRILAAVDEAGERVQRIGDGRAGLLRIGATALAGYTFLPRLARIAARELPDLVLSFVPGLLTPAGEAALADDRVDVALLRPPLRRTDLASRLVARERLVVAVPAGHRLAGDEAVALAELRGADVVGFADPDSAVEAAVRRVCAAAGFVPRRVATATETSVLLTLVAAGRGVAVLPESVRALRVDGVRYVPLADTDAGIDLVLVRRAADQIPALVALVEALEANGFVAPAG